MLLEESTLPQRQPDSCGGNRPGAAASRLAAREIGLAVGESRWPLMKSAFPQEPAVRRGRKQVGCGGKVLCASDQAENFCIPEQIREFKRVSAGIRAGNDTGRGRWGCAVRGLLSLTEWNDAADRRSVLSGWRRWRGSWFSGGSSFVDERLGLPRRGEAGSVGGCQSYGLR